MRYVLFAIAGLAMISAPAEPAETAPAPPKVAKSKVDPAVAAADTKEDIRRHRIIAAALEAAAKCREAGRSEDACMAELAKACARIAYGKYRGMKHPD